MPCTRGQGAPVAFGSRLAPLLLLLRFPVFFEMSDHRALQVNFEYLGRMVISLEQRVYVLEGFEKVISLEQRVFVLEGFEEALEPRLSGLERVITRLQNAVGRMRTMLTGFFSHMREATATAAEEEREASPDLEQHTCTLDDLST